MAWPSEDNLRWLAQTYAKWHGLLAPYLTEAVLIEPTGTYFPDAFKPDAESVATLLRRIYGYAPLREGIPLQLSFLEAEESGGGCSSGACSPSMGPKKSVPRWPLRDEASGGYVLPIATEDVAIPPLLAARLVASVGALVVLEADEDATHGSLESESELAMATVGLGLISLQGACFYKKGCSGLRAHQGTVLSVEELSIAVALYCEVHRIKPSKAHAHLAVTQKEAFDEAVKWVRSNPDLVASLRATPEAVTQGLFQLQPARGFFERLFHRRGSSELPSPSSAVKANRPRSEAERQRIAEAKALVEEVFGE